MDERLNNSMILATKETLSSVLGVDTVCSSPVEEVINTSGGETSVVIGFVGGISGAFTLKCSRELCVQIASDMLGEPVPLDSEDAKDAVGELFNMIVGTAKTHYGESNGSFRMSVPTTIIGEDYTVHVKANQSSTVSVLKFQVGGEVLHIEVYVN